MPGEPTNTDGDAPRPAPERLARVKAATAGEIAARLDLSEEAEASLGDGTAPPAAYLRALIEAGHLADAIGFLAHALPKREGAWWAAQCARTLDLGEETSLARRTVRAAEAWVVEPREPARQAAMDLAEELGEDHPASWAAMAAFWSGDSLLPPDMAPVRPDPVLSCRAVAGAVMMTAAEGPGPAVPDRQRALLAKGLDIANGGDGREATRAQGGATIPGTASDPR